MRMKSVLWWLAGLAAVVLVMTAGAWSLSTATAFADEPTSAASDATSTTKTPDDPPDQLPGESQLPLQEKVTSSGNVKPATFTISGKKYLVGRPLKAGEFSFSIAEAGAYKVPERSDLPKQLKSNTLTPDEKYQLVAYSGFDYHPNSLQPLPNPSTVTNAADGTVAFPSITIEGKALGETATSRHHGIVFCYNIVEQPPRDADGQLLEGVTKDAQGRYVYQGVTYDDCVKHLYLYAYETVNEDRSSSVAIIPLGDATFDGVPVRTASGKGVGFRNSFSGALLESYDGLVFLEGEAIAAGEFNFDVHEVTETGSLIDDQHVACAAGAGGAQGAEVPVISDATFDKAGTYYFAVSQQAPAKSETARVQLDDTAYAVTVQVTEGADGALDASVAAVRKKAAVSDQWTEVSLDAKPSPLVWDNKVVKDEGATPDTPGATTPDKPDTGGSDSGATVPDAPAVPEPDKPGDSSQPTEPDKPGGADQPGATVPPTDTDGAGGSEGDGDAGDSGATETPDKPSAPGQGADTEGDGSTGDGDQGGGNGGAGSTAPGSPDDGSNPGSGPGADISGTPDGDEPNHGGDISDEGGAAAKPEGGQGTTIETTPSHEGSGAGSESDQDANAAASDAKDDKSSSDKTSISLATKPFAQTGDTLAVGMIALAVLAVACVIVLIIARKRRNKDK